MKILLITIISLVVIGARGEWRRYGPGAGSGGGSSYQGQGSSWGRGYPQQIGSNVEWVCRNPRTNDMMVIASDNTQQQYPSRGPWWEWQNVPSGHQNYPQENHHQENHHPGNSWIQPIVIVEQEPTRTDGNQMFTTQTPETHNNHHHHHDYADDNNNNSNNQPSTTPHNHGGEGMIDVRLGASKR